MDNFSEQLVKKQPTGNERLKNLITVAGGSLLTLILIVAALLMLGHGIITFILLLVSVLSAFGTFRAFRNTKVEYEYTYTNGDLDIDKIIAQSKRVELLTVQVSKFTSFGKYDDENIPEETEDMTVVMATNNIASEEFYADFPHDEYGNTRLVFCPDERMLENIKKGLHPAVRNKFNSTSI